LSFLAFFAALRETNLKTFISPVHCAHSRRQDRQGTSWFRVLISNLKPILRLSFFAFFAALRETGFKSIDHARSLRLLKTPRSPKNLLIQGFDFKP
jgi:hypothetical protein